MPGCNKKSFTIGANLYSNPSSNLVFPAFIYENVTKANDYFDLFLASYFYWILPLPYRHLFNQERDKAMEGKRKS